MISWYFLSFLLALFDLDVIHSLYLLYRLICFSVPRIGGHNWINGSRFSNDQQDGYVFISTLFISVRR
jgi:hypothetical protein